MWENANSRGRARLTRRLICELQRGDYVLYDGAQLVTCLETFQSDPARFLASTRGLLQLTTRWRVGDQAPFPLTATFEREQAAEIVRAGRDLKAAPPRFQPCDRHQQALVALAIQARMSPAVVTAQVAPSAAGADELFLDVSGEQLLATSATSASDIIACGSARLPLQLVDDVVIHAFRTTDDGLQHLALMIGRIDPDDAPLVRVHSSCITGDLLGSLRCDCGAQLRLALEQMSEEGAGIVVYLAQEGRGIGLAEKVRAYALQDDGLDTLVANRMLGWDDDHRSYGAAVAILNHLGVRRCRLLSNNPAKVAQLASGSVDVVEQVPLVAGRNPYNDAYLEAKRAHCGHDLPR